MAITKATFVVQTPPHQTFRTTRARYTHPQTIRCQYIDFSLTKKNNFLPISMLWTYILFFFNMHPPSAQTFCDKLRTLPSLLCFLIRYRVIGFLYMGYLDREARFTPLLLSKCDSLVSSRNTCTSSHFKSQKKTLSSTWSQ